jgi:hypothetical protein
MARHEDFFLAPSEVKLQNTDTPLIHHIFINLAVACLVGIISPRPRKSTNAPYNYRQPC